MALDIDTSSIQQQLREVGRQAAEIADAIRHLPGPVPRRRTVPPALVIGAIALVALVATAFALWMTLLRPGLRMATRRSDDAELETLDDLPTPDPTPGLTGLDVEEPSISR